jgi:TPR repeat protein
MSKSIDDDNISLCANCGNGEESAGDLKTCTSCKMVKYCNRDCQIAHRPQHKKACKKRAAELHDEKLFKLPPPAEDCPICMLPLPFLHTGSKYKSCCGKLICSGCIYAVAIRDGGVGLCPFCRAPTPTAKEIIEQMKKRMELDDANAICDMGGWYFSGRYGLPQNHAKALELWHRAGELGSATSYYLIGVVYDLGEGVGRDEKKATYYYELAATESREMARHNLGMSEGRAGNIDRALKHFMIAAGFGEKASLEKIKEMFMAGEATKDDYAKALQAYQANLVEIKSPQRDQAAAFNDRYKCY